MLRPNSITPVLAAALLSAAAPAAFAQTVTGGTSGGLGSDQVNASTSGYGTQTTTPDGGSALGAGGDANATAANGGSANTKADAKVNDRRAMQSSMANARDDDEFARSRTRTIARHGVVRSRTMSLYHEKGQGAQHEMTYSVTTPEGTTTKTK